MPNSINRRQWIQSTSASVMGAGWLTSLAAASEEGPKPPRSCVLLWMNGGPFKPIETKVPGITFSEHLPGIAKWADKLAIIRSMSTKEGDHGRARDNLRTGYFPQGSIEFPVLGALVAREAGEQAGDLPSYVSIFSRGLFGPGTPPAGYLGPKYAPLLVGREGFGAPQGGRLTVDNLSLAQGVSPQQSTDRLALLKTMEDRFLGARPGDAAESHRTAYSKAIRLMSPGAAGAFSLDDEPGDLQERYGRSQFGQGCLLARRLVERHVPFIEVTLGGWDTHDDNFPRVRSLSQNLDQAWSALMQDLSDRGLLETTLVVWMGEFGRTPVINPRQGRDHYPKAWSVALGGAGIRGGQVIGRTSADGLTVEDRPVSTPDLLATICTALGLDPRKQNPSNVGRPIRLVDPSGEAIKELVSAT